MPRVTPPRSTMRLTSKLAGISGALLASAAVFAANYYPAEKAALWVLAVCGGAALLFFFAAERHILSRAPGSRVAKYGANATAITLAFLGILVILNVLAVRHNEKWDLTAEGLYTRSEQTLKVLDNLDQDVTITAFFTDGAEERGRMKGLLDDYTAETDRLTVAFVDPDKNPVLAQQHNIREYGTSVFESEEQVYRITQTSEEAVTNALVRVTREGKKSVVFLSGHDERSLQETQRAGYSTAKQALEEQGYAVKELLLLREGEVPVDCHVLVVAGPVKPFLVPEVEALRAYLAGGGRMLLLVDPQTRPGLDALLEEWGIELHDDMIIDTMSRLFGGSYTTPILTDYPDPALAMEARTPTFMPSARSIDHDKELPDGVTFRALVQTNPQTWGETDASNPKASFDPSRDYKGPLAVAALFEKSGDDGTAGAQILVVGDSEFADNRYFNLSGNGDLFQNMVSYLAKEEDLISIRPKDSQASPLVLTRAQAASLFYGGVALAPLALALVGLGIWWRRRNL